MAHHVTLVAAVALLGVVPAIADAKPSLFPQTVLAAGGGPSFPTKLDEPPLWNSQGQTTQRIRLFIGGSTKASWSVRLDQSQDGRWMGYFREHDGHRLRPLVRFSVSGVDVQELEALIAKSKLWEIYPQFWQSTATGPGAICLDGMTVIFETVSSAGYRYSEGNAQCTLAPAQLAVAAKLMRMAGHTDLERLLH